MAHDVFISYSTSDKTIADAACAWLEERGVRCWIAPRDILPGVNWANSLTTAISESHLLVLVFSSGADDSLYVLSEITHAVKERVPILSFRIEDREPSAGLGLFLGPTHWLDAIAPPLEDHLRTLCDVVLVLLGQAEVGPGQSKLAEVTEGGLEQLVRDAPRTAHPPTTLVTYLERLQQEVEERFSTELVRPDRMYVPQYASPLGDEAAEVELDPVTKAFWVENEPRVAVIGNYGMGKTYFGWRTVIEQIERCEAGRDQVIPVLYPLRKFSYAETAEAEGQGKDLIDQVRAHVLSLEFPAVDRKHFVRSLEDGKVGVILDGLDELSLPQDVGWQEALQPILDVHGARVMITGRPAYFEDPTRELRGFTAFELLPWGEREWTAYVDRMEESTELRDVGGKEALLSAVAARSSLSSLTTRPLWCYMIVSIAPEIIQLDDLGLAGLYQRFLKSAIRRRRMPTSLLSMAWTYCVMERFAEKAIRTGASSIPEDEVQILIDHLFESIGSKDLRVFLNKEVRAYAFLNCDRDRRYNFGHKSFEDYFAACASGRWVAEQATDESSGPPEAVSREPLLADHRLSEEQLDFTVGIVQDEEIQASLDLVPTEARKHLHSKLLRFLEQRLGTDDDPPILRANLFSILVGLLRGTDPRPRVTGAMLQNTNLSGLDLHDCDFLNVDFSGGALSNSTLTGASFAGCSFFGTAVDGADFTNADLAGADLVGIELEREEHLPVLSSVRGIDRARVTKRERRMLSIPD